MNKFASVILFLICLNCFSQNSLNIIDNEQYSSFYINDTILGIPIFSNNSFDFYSNTKLNKFISIENKNITLDFSEFISSCRNFKFSLISDNNLIHFGFPSSNKYYSFGYNLSSYFDVNISNELIDLFWNGNSQYLNNFVGFYNNSGSLLQFSTLYFQISFLLNENLKFGSRINFLHGINYLNFENANFSLYSSENNITPFSTSIETDILYRSSNANYFGFSNPGFSINIGAEYKLKNWKFLLDIRNLGFIFWQKKNKLSQSNESYDFNGVYYTMDEIFTEEVNQTIDTLESLFSLDDLPENNFITRLPFRANINSSYSINSSTDLFIKYFVVEKNNSGYIHHAFLGAYKSFNEIINIQIAYNLNNIGFENLQLGLSKRFKNLFIELNTNNIFSLFDFLSTNYLNFQTRLTYVF
ncbi:MAG: hypothetical protein CMP68_01625 [Flavobacteriales bacterium]|nr:hypothetical protein [Flavobacteriales bacterium]|tara:strand:- start:14508 stop:15749 length:1242 start_codon:yes stop_codon:yes gene_type:complete